MNKDNFQVILDRQQQSELIIKDFCENEFHFASRFHYWKSKHRLSCLI